MILHHRYLNGAERAATNSAAIISLLSRCGVNTNAEPDGCKAIEYEWPGYLKWSGPNEFTLRNVRRH